MCEFVYSRLKTEGQLSWRRSVKKVVNVICDGETLITQSLSKVPGRLLHLHKLREFRMISSDVPVVLGNEREI